jgi:hypothetical protein
MTIQNDRHHTPVWDKSNAGQEASLLPGGLL